MEQVKQATSTASPFVEALQSVLQAEGKCLSWYLEHYGDEFLDSGKTLGEERFKESGLADLIDTLKSALKEQIGEAVEVSLIDTMNQEEVSKC